MSLSRIFVGAFAIASLSSASLPASANDASQLPNIQIESIQLVELHRCRRPNASQCVSVKWRAVGDFQRFNVQLRGRNVTEDTAFFDFPTQRAQSTAREALFATFLNSTDTLGFEAKVSGFSSGSLIPVIDQFSANIDQL